MRFKKTNVNGEVMDVRRLFKNDRCAIGQASDGRYVVWIRETKQYFVFAHEDGHDLNAFLMRRSLVGLVLYQGRRAGYDMKLVELPERGFSLSYGGDAELFDGDDIGRTELTDTLIGMLGFNPNNPADIHVLKKVGDYYKEY